MSVYIRKMHILAILLQLPAAILFICYVGKIMLYMYYKTYVQATPAISTSRISILPLMSKWFFIPNIFSLYFFAFQLCLCQKWSTWSNGYLEVIFHAVDIFSIIFTTVYVEVKIGAHMGAILSASAMYMY